MENTVKAKVRNKISYSRFGTLFFVSSFSEFDEEYISRLLPMFEREGLLTRLAKGVYIKAKQSRFGAVFPPIGEIVAKIANRDHAIAIPTGDMAANKLGFSTQVPMNPVYLTSGSSRKLKLGRRIVVLKHGSPRNFAYHGAFMPELIQALTAIGRENIDEHIEQRIRKLLVENPEPKTFQHDLAIAPAWIRHIIKQLNLK